MRRGAAGLTFPAVRAVVQEIFTALLFAQKPRYMRWMEKEQRGKDFLDDRAHGREGQTGGPTAHALALDVGVRDGREDDMMLPAGIAPALEMIEPQFGFEVLILPFDRPALGCEGHQRAGR